MLRRTGKILRLVSISLFVIPMCLLGCSDCWTKDEQVPPAVHNDSVDNREAEASPEVEAEAVAEAVDKPTANGGKKRKGKKQ